MQNTKLIFALCILLFKIVIAQDRAADSLKVMADSLYCAALSHHEAGMLLIQHGEIQNGTKELIKSSEDFNDYDYWNSDFPDSVKLVFSKLLIDYPQSPVYNYNMSRWYLVNQRDSAGLSLAKEFSMKSVDLNNLFTPAYMLLARLNYDNFDTEEAIKLYKQVLNIDSNNTSACYRLSKIYERSGNHAEEAVFKDRLFKIDSLGEYSTWVYIDSADASNSFENKSKLLEKAFSQAGTKHMKSIALERKILSLRSQPAEISLPLLKAIIQSDLGKEKDTRQRALESIYWSLYRSDREKIPGFAERIIEEKNPHLLYTVGKFCFDSLSQKELGLNLIARAYDITDAESTYKTIFYGPRNAKVLYDAAREAKFGWIGFGYGKAEYELGNYTVAENILKQTLDYSDRNGDPNSYYYLGFSLAAQNRNKEAVKALTTGLAIKDDKKARKSLYRLTSNKTNEAKNKLNDLISILNINKSADDLINDIRRKRSTPAPNFNLPSLNGHQTSSDQIRGKVILLDFWATWCLPCIKELPVLSKLYNKYSEDSNVEILSINVSDLPPVIEKFMNENGYTFNVLVGSGKNAMNDFGVDSIPTIFLIDRNGYIQFKHVGFDSKENISEQLTKEIEELLAEDF